MSTQVETVTNNGLNIVKWVLAVVILIAATVGNRYAPELLPQLPAVGRVAALIVLAAVAVVLTLTTSQGKSFLKLLKEAQIEARRVVWPTKDETLQTTLIVLAVVLVMSKLLKYVRNSKV